MQKGEESIKQGIKMRRKKMQGNKKEETGKERSMKE